jgi:uncharacterized membrane protein
MTRLAHARIERAIREAETGTTGHIVVRIVPEADVDAFARAREEFTNAGLHGSKEGNTALILVAPQARKFAVIGDRELHARVGDAFWQQLVKDMVPLFTRGKSDAAIISAVDRIGAQLREHFPVAG